MSERAELLAGYEAAITQVREALIVAAEALLAIKEQTLFVDAGYKSFDRYCRERWGLNHSRSYQLIDLALVRRDIPVNTESQARRIAPALRADREGVKAAFELLLASAEPPEAVQELARSLGRKRTPQKTIRGVDPVPLPQVYVVIGLHRGTQAPEVHVTRDQEAGIELRNRLIAARTFRRVLLYPCAVEDGAEVLAS